MADATPGQNGDLMTPEEMQEAAEMQRFLATADAEKREAHLRETVRARVAAVLNNASIKEDSNFLENGLTSLTALELSRKLMNLTGVEIPIVAIVEYPTPAELGCFLSTEFAANNAATTR